MPKAFQFKGTMTVYISRSSRPLPVEVTFKQTGNDDSSTSMLSDWGERVSVRPPASTISINRL